MTDSVDTVCQLRSDLEKVHLDPGLDLDSYAFCSHSGVMHIVPLDTAASCDKIAFDGFYRPEFRACYHCHFGWGLNKNGKLPQLAIDRILLQCPEAVSFNSDLWSHRCKVTAGTGFDSDV